MMMNYKTLVCKILFISVQRIKISYKLHFNVLIFDLIIFRPFSGWTECTQRRIFFSKLIYILYGRWCGVISCAYCS